MDITLNKTLVKEQVKVVREFLKTSNIKMTQSTAYELVSQMYGFKSWNYLSANLKNYCRD